MTQVEPTLLGRSLENQELGDLRDALLAGYRTPELRLQLNDSLGFELEDYVNVAQPRRELFDDLVRSFDREGRALELLALAWSQKPGNPKLKEIGQRLIGDVGPLQARFDRQRRIADAPVLSIDDDEALEKLVTSRSPLILFSEYQRRLEEIGRAICLVETPAMVGTGFLIGEHSVLTNYHVVQEAVKSGLHGDQIRLLFDFDRPDAHGEVSGTAVKVAAGAGWLVDSKPYSQSDLTGKGEPGPGELDFALIRLGEPVPGDRVALRLPTAPTAVVPLDIAVIAQHPGGDALSLAMGVVVDFPGSGLRYRYNTTTKSGSSGSPVFSVSLDLIGLHHAADPQWDPKYNQAVPLWRIAGALAASSNFEDL